MTLQADLITIAWVQVGEGVDASAQYPVLSTACAETVSGPDGETRESYRERTWTMKCMAIAASLADRQTLRDTLESTLARRGHRVRQTLSGTTRTMAAPGAAGALPGYPVVEVSDVEADSFGPVITFSLRATTREPIADGGGVVEHTATTEETTDRNGLVTVRVEGEVRLQPGSDAKSWAETNVLDPAAAAADAADLAFERRTRVGLDAAVCSYSYTTAETGLDLGGGVTKAAVEDVTVASDGGRVTRTVSGSAEGTDALLYAQSLKPTLAATELLTEERVSAASVPDGRVSFSYTVLSGRQPGVTPGGGTYARFGTLVVFAYDESVSPSGGGAPIVVQTFHGSDPVIGVGRTRPYVYQQTQTLEFMGSWSDGEAALDGLMDAANLDGAATFDRGSGRYGIKRIRSTRRYVYATAQTTPSARELPPL